MGAKVDVIPRICTFIDDKLGYFFSRYPLWFVFLNPIPDGNMISLDKTGKSFRQSSQRQT
jgi:hypothetical protein